MKKWKMGASLLLVGAMTLTAACSFGANEPQEEEERVLRIASSWGMMEYDDYVRSQWTELFEFANPHITIEIVPTLPADYYNKPYEEQESTVELLRRTMEGDQPPDLILMYLEHLPQLTEMNLLAPLEPYIQRDRVDMSQYVPAVIDGITEIGGGQLYAMAPSFSSQALIYNIDLFEKAGVPVPHDGMTWQELFDLAAQLSRPEEYTYGFSFSNYMGSDLFWEIMNYVTPLGLRYIDPDSGRMVVDSDQWEQVWRTFADLTERVVLPPSGYDPETGMPRAQDPNAEPGPFSYDMFLSGKVAMTLVSHGQITDIIRNMENAENFEGFEPFRWDLVSVPSHPEAPGVGGNMYIDGLMGVAANAQNSDDAWELIKFVNSYDWARLKSRSLWNLSTFQEFVVPRPGYNYNVDAFARTKPALPLYGNDLYQKYPNVWELQQIGYTKLQEVLDGQKEIRQALQEWQTEGDAAIQRMLDEKALEG